MLEKTVNKDVCVGLEYLVLMWRLGWARDVVGVHQEKARDRAFNASSLFGG